MSDQIESNEMSENISDKPSKESLELYMLIESLDKFP